MICKNVLLAGLTLCSCIACYGQIVTSAAHGYWHEPSTWSTGIVPSNENSSHILIEHEIKVNAAHSILTSHTEIVNEGILLVESDASLTLVHDAEDTLSELKITGGVLQVFGTLQRNDSTIIEGTLASNTFFNDGSVYHHLGGPKTHIPYATWHPESTFKIAGFKGSGYINRDFRSGWEQTFGHVIYNCPQQTTFVDLNGALRNIAGNFIIQNTNSQAFRLSTSQESVINVAGNFQVEGPSHVWISMQSDSMILNIGKDFIYKSTSSGASYFNTRGLAWISIQGNMIMDTPGTLRMNSANADSTGVRRTTLNVNGSLQVASGKFIAPSPGKAVVIFDNSVTQTIQCTASAFDGNFHFVIPENAAVDLQNSVLASSTGALMLKGKLIVGSLEPDGAIQLINKGNIQVQGTRTYYNGATIEYKATSSQQIGAGHPYHAQVNLILNNDIEVSLLQDISVNKLTIYKGSMQCYNHQLHTAGDIIVNANAAVIVNNLYLEGNASQSISLQGAVINDVEINKPTGGEVALISPLNVKRQLRIVTANTLLNSNGNLTLLSTADDAAGSACVSSLPVGSSILGDVTVQRHMAGEGRIYRYLSSPVTAASVSSMKDDFPVTGTFEDPSKGKGISSTTPSLFLYDAAAVVWKPYPEQGLAQNNFLQPGRGYAAFIRAAKTSTIWDVTGVLNQGVIDLPVEAPSNENDYGWNLVGNPYPSAIDWDSEDGWIKSDSISSTIAVRDNATGTFRYWDEAVGDLEEGHIASGQAFWIRATDKEPMLTINEQAKFIQGANFYRENKQEVDYLEIGISETSVLDKTYIRLKSEAQNVFDSFDAPKLSNDFLSLSVLSPDQHKLAISAIADIECMQQFNLRLEFSLNNAGEFMKHPKGDYSMHINPYGLFKNSNIILTDAYTRQTIPLTSKGYSFSIDEVAASYAMDRFAITVESPTVSDSIIKYANNYVCTETPYTLKVSKPLPGIMYTYFVNGDQVQTDAFEDEFYYRLKFADTLFNVSRNEVVVQASSICRTVADTIIVQREIIAAPSVLKMNRCLKDFIEIVLDKNFSDGQFHWYESNQASKPFRIQEDAIFISPDLDRGKSFYVSKVSKNGCESARKEITVYGKVDSTVLKLEYKHGVLSSNHFTGNTWFYNDILLADTTQSISIMQPGNYKVVVNAGDCSLETNFILGVTDIKEQCHPDFINISPVPFNTELRVKRKFDHTLKTFTLLSVKGEVIQVYDFHNDEMIIDTSELPSGLYFVRAQNRSGVQYVKVVKH